MSKRLQRVESRIREEVATLIRENLDTERFGWISVTGVKVAPDLSEARVFVTVFPEHLEGRALEKLNSSAGFFRKVLSKSLKTKTVPRLRFEIDTLTKLVESGKIKPPEG